MQNEALISHFENARNAKALAQGRNFAKRFESVFQRLLSGENLDLYQEGLSTSFEFIAANLLGGVPARKFAWFDGVAELTATVRKSRQVEFKGKMWVGDDSRMQWQEDFRATVTDKRMTKQDIWITIWIGADKAEGTLLAASGVSS